MIGLKGTLRFVQCVYSFVQFLLCSTSYSSLSVLVIYKTQTSRDSKPFLSTTKGYPTLFCFVFLVIFGKFCFNLYYLGNFWHCLLVFISTFPTSKQRDSILGITTFYTFFTVLRFSTLGKAVCTSIKERIKCVLFSRGSREFIRTKRL